MSVDTSWMSDAIRGYESNIAALQSRTADLDAKIQRLEAAKSAVDAAHQDDESFVSWVRLYDVGANWQGSRREEFETTKTSAASAGDEYCEAVNGLYHTICDKITELENERADGFGAISSAYQCLNNISNLLQQALHDL